MTGKKKPQRMEDVYASVYVALAASSAVDLKSGFLERIVNSEYIYTQDGSGRQVHECMDVEDFDNHVEKAQLNTRAWVMQEGSCPAEPSILALAKHIWNVSEGYTGRI